MKEQAYDITEPFKKRYDDAKAEMSRLRKKGQDPKIAELILSNVPSKIQMAAITQSEKDMDSVKQILFRAEKEITELKLKRMQESAKKQLEDSDNKEQADKNEDSAAESKNESLPDEIAQRTNKLINDTFTYISNKQYNEALRSYLEIRSNFPNLPQSLKAHVHAKIISIHKLLVKSGLLNN